MNTCNGFIYLHRKMKDWEWYSDNNIRGVFIHLVLFANHENNNWQGTEIQRGQIVVGRNELSKTLGISQQSIRTTIKKLKSTNEITTKSTNKYTIITIIKYDDYQNNRVKLTNKTTSKLTNEQPTTNQQLTTNNKDNKDNNINKEQLLATDVAVKEPDEVNLLLGEFKKDINPTINFGNTTQRKSCMDLIKQFGYEKVLNTLNYYRTIQTDKYAPTITTPLQLKEKMGQLIAFYNKSKSPQKGDMTII